MPRQGKVWGETEEIFNNGTVSINLLRIKAGGYCSEHRHSKKSNIFFVLSGELKIDIWRERIGMIDSTIIRQGESTMIESGLWHKFEALNDVECLEVYEIKLSSDDIERRTSGGMK